MGSQVQRDEGPLAPATQRRREQQTSWAFFSCRSTSLSSEVLPSSSESFCFFFFFGSSFSLSPPDAFDLPNPNPNFFFGLASALSVFPSPYASAQSS